MMHRVGTRPVPAAPGRHGPVGGLHEGRCALAIFFLFAGFYLLTTSGHFYAVDEETLYGMTESIVERHSLALPPGMWYIPGDQAARGPVYAPYMPGQPLAAVPLYVLGRAVAPLFPPASSGYITRFFVSLFGSLVTAATVAVLYLLARTLGYRRSAALGLAAVYGLATMAWPHGRTFFAEPFTTLLVLCSFYGLCQGMREGGPRRVGWCAAAAVAAVAALGVKPHAAVVLPFLGMYLLGKAAAPSLVGGHWRIDLRGAALALGGWMGGIALVAAPLAAYNTALYGGPLRTGYGSRPLSLLDPSSYPIFAPEGLYGLVLSSGKGFLWYSPPVILALGAFWLFYHRHRAEALTCLGILVSNIWFYSRLPTWHGDGSWGPRFLALALPFALLPLVELLERLSGRRALTALVVPVVALGLVVQLLGVLVNFDWYILRSDEATRHFSPRASPIVAHARLLGERFGEWYARVMPGSDIAVLTGGFAAREGGAAGVPLPRWTTGDGTITLHPGRAGAALVKLTFFDHRPTALRGESITVLLNGVPLANRALERRDFTGTKEGWVYQFTVPAEMLVGGSATVTLHSVPWNPKATGQGERDEDLGVFLNNVEVWSDGRSWRIGEALLPPPMPSTPRGRFWWFNDDRPPDETRHQLIDLWAWYAAVAGFSRQVATTWISGYAACCLLLSLVGLILLRPFLPHPPWLHRRAIRRRGATPTGARRKKARQGGEAGLP